MVKTNVEIITPAVAAAYLKTNTEKQRPLNKGQVAFYARMMSEGQWQLNGEPIVFNVNGELINGQHRCAACIEANVPFETVVVRDVEDKCFYTFDTGRKRSNAQILSIEGIPNAARIAAGIQMYMKLQISKVTSIESTKASRASAHSKENNKLSTADILGVYNEDVQYWQDLVRIVACMYKRCKLLNSSEVFAIIAFLHKVKKYDFDFVVNFFEQLFYDERTELPIIRKLRGKLVDNAMSGGMKMTGLYRTQLLIKTWECYKNNKSPNLLKWVRGVEPEHTFE